jgi:hypothetical protein
VIEWLDDFYNSDDMRSTLLRTLGPVFSAYALDVWRADGGKGDPPQAFVGGLVASYIDHHLNSSRIQLQELLKATDETGALDALRGRLDEWAEKRPGKVAANETVRAANALAVERMRSEGVVIKRWASSGSDTCPYCASLNGTAVEIERPFFTDSDTYQPEGAETPLTFTSSIGHPPVHQGCDCSVVPG